MVQELLHRGFWLDGGGAGAARTAFGSQSLAKSGSEGACSACIAAFT